MFFFCAQLLHILYISIGFYFTCNKYPLNEVKTISCFLGFLGGGFFGGGGACPFIGKNNPMYIVNVCLLTPCLKDTDYIHNLRDRIILPSTLVAKGKRKNLILVKVKDKRSRSP